ncbi:hypothetical protein ANACOL_01788 [Anaerotruncus colihominis DSM 17241]|uniref:Uncharacterized protein n=1 Tax=Anaerotruncus colihominis DSM 17241 TaxID=445972 RepID=B0PAI8_9FIRM|nr:hypothetical protein ANACOL_01788 [Anaerotruncus colihominis DSM 17241]
MIGYDAMSRRRICKSVRKLQSSLRTPSDFIYRRPSANAVKPLKKAATSPALTGAILFASTPALYRKIRLNRCSSL